MVSVIKGLLFTLVPLSDLIQSPHFLPYCSSYTHTLVQWLSRYSTGTCSAAHVRHGAWSFRTVKVKSARAILLRINPGCTWPPRCWSTLSSRQSSKQDWSPALSSPLPDCPTILHALNHHQKAAEQTRSKQSISSLLIHSPPSRTDSPHDKSLDGNYLCLRGGGPAMVTDDNPYFIRLRTAHGLTAAAEPRGTSMKHHFPTSPWAKMGGKSESKQQARDRTSTSRPSQGVDNVQSWSKSILKVFLCPQGTP